MRCVNCSSNKVPSLETEVAREVSWLLCILPFDFIRSFSVLLTRTAFHLFGSFVRLFTVLMRGVCVCWTKICIYVGQSWSHRVNDIKRFYKLSLFASVLGITTLEEDEIGLKKTKATAAPNSKVMQQIFIFIYFFLVLFHRIKDIVLLWNGA